VFLCNPNNPTGTYLSREEVGGIVEAVGDGLLVLDEACADFLDGRWTVPPGWIEDGRVVVLRSLSKVCSMYCMGLGYAVACPDVLARIRAARFPAILNGITAAGGVAYLDDPAIAERTREAVREGKGLLLDGLARLGLQVVPGAANFVMVKVGDSRRVRWALMRDGILVKDMESYGMPSFIRMAVPAPADVPRVMEAFARLARAAVESP
jgi:histidinol-phosphate aminotransferase